MVDNKRLDQFMQNLGKNEIIVPPELTTVIKNRIDTIPLKTVKLKSNCRRALIATSVFLIALSLLINYSPGFAKYAANLPLLNIVVEWFHGDAGTLHAKKSGYQEITALATVSSNGYMLEFKNIMFDEDRFVMSIVASGESFADNAPDYYYLELSAQDFEEIPSSIHYDFFTRGDSVITESGLLIFRAEKIFADGEVQDFLSKNLDQLTINALLSYEVNGKTEQVEFHDIKIPFDRNQVLFSERHAIGQDYYIREGVITVDQLIISPSRMRVLLSAELVDHKIYIISKSSLQDNHGNIYNPEEGLGAAWRYDSITCFFVPSLYFSEAQEELYFTVSIWVAPDDDQIVTLQLDDNYPQTLNFMGEDIIVQNFYHDDHALYINLTVPHNIMLFSLQIDDMLHSLGTGDSIPADSFIPPAFMANADDDSPRNLLFKIDVEQKPEYEVTFKQAGRLVKIEEKIVLLKND